MFPIAMLGFIIVGTIVLLKRKADAGTLPSVPGGGTAIPTLPGKVPAIPIKDTFPTLPEVSPGNALVAVLARGYFVKLGNGDALQFARSNSGIDDIVTLMQSANPSKITYRLPANPGAELQNFRNEIEAIDNSIDLALGSERKSKSLKEQIAEKEQGVS